MNREISGFEYLERFTFARPQNLFCRLTLCISLLNFAGGCASFTPVAIESKHFRKPVSVSADIGREYTVINHFNKEQKAPLLFLMRLMPTGAPFDLEATLQNEPAVLEGDAVVNLSIRGEAALGDILLPIVFGIGGGLIYPPLYFFTVTPLFEDLKTYTVSGDVVKYREKTVPATDMKFDPVTGLPVEKSPLQYDPETGLPVKR